MSTEIGKIIDMPLEEFGNLCKSFDLGYLMGLHNYFLQLYSNVCSVRDQIHSSFNGGRISETEAKSTLIQIYSQLQVLEDKIFYLRGEIKIRSEIPLNGAVQS